MATAAGSSVEAETLRLAFPYLVNSRIDSTSTAVLPAPLSACLISESQRSECDSETDSFMRADKFLDHMREAVNNNYHTFVQALKETSQARIASLLEG